MSKVVHTRTKTASSSKPQAPKAASKPKPLVSVKAEPLSEDEFEVESKGEAKAYAERQAVEHKRAEVKAENEQRKQQGLALLPVPRKVKDPKKKVQGYESEEEGEEEDVKVGGKRKRDFPDEERELEYEGQIKLPFNPLFSLAGLSDPDDKYRRDLREKQALIDAYFQSSNNEIAKDVKPAGIAAETAETATAPALASVLDAKVEVKAEESEEEAEGEYDDDDQVIVPWGVVTQAEAVQVKDEAAEGEEEEAEGVYSDDEYVQDTSYDTTLVAQRRPSTQSQSQSQTQSFDPSAIDVISQKPSFPYTDVQAQIGPLLLDAAVGGVSVPAPINMFLKEYQRAGVRFLYGKYKEERGGILGDDMGLGKTIQVIAFLTAIMRKSNTKEDYWRRKQWIRGSGSGSIPPKHWPTALIVCPSSLIRNWDREMDSWGYFEKAILKTENCDDVKRSFNKGFLDVVLTSFNQLQANIEHIKDLPFSVVIADEAHRLKEPRAARTLAIKKMQCTSCFGLTGTLIQNRMEEMWSVLDFVQRGWAGTIKQWREFAVLPIKRGHRLDGTAEEVTLGIIHHTLLRHFYLRRDKRLIADELPEKKDIVVFCPLAERQILAYQRLIQSDDIQFILRRKEPCDCGSEERRLDCHYTRTADGETVPQVVLKNITALQKVANHFGLLYHSKDDPPDMRKVNERIFEICTGVSYDNKQDNPAAAALDVKNCGKWTLLAELMQQWRGESEKRNKVLIFSNSVRLLKMIYEFINLNFSGFESQMFTGEANETDRMAMVDNFQDPEQDHFVMLISTQAGGVGLNLTAANKVVIFDPDWNPANDLQAMDRAFRIGQQRTVEVYRLIGLGTLEELKYERQIHKQQRARQLNQGTFERRIHQGMDGGKTEEDQGELFGTHNIFKFNPKGFVKSNLERVQLAEDRFAQDLINAEYDEEDELVAGVDGDDDDDARKMRDARRNQDMQRQARSATDRAKREDNRKVSDVLSDDEDHKPGQDQDIFAKMGILAQVHDTAFKDSPAERKIYEIGVQLLKDNPALAKTMKANDLGKLGLKKRASGSARTSLGSNAGTGAGPSKARRIQPEQEDEPWKARFTNGKPKKGGKLIALSDSD